MVRPTPGRIREAMFSSLMEVIPGATVLDLYAGTGSLGLECLSRGADRVVFVEADREVQRFLRRNADEILRRMKLAPGFVEIWPMKVRKAMEQAEIRRRRFDLIMADPPYRQEEDEQPAALWVAGEIGRRGLLRPGGWLTLEHPHDARMPDSISGLRQWKSKNFGRSVLTMYFAPREEERES
jgi:16S rRNA (guanine(966)-N(2))-methyltransferase RsmD